MWGFIIGVVLTIPITLYCSRSDFRKKVNTWILARIDSFGKNPEKKNTSRTKRIVKTETVKKTTVDNDDF